MLPLFLLSVALFIEGFHGGAPNNQWETFDQFVHSNVSQCGASHVFDPQYCLHTLANNSVVIKRSKIMQKLEKPPLFLQFHARSTPHRCVGEVAVKLANENGPVFSLGLSYGGKWPIWTFNSSDQVLSSGRIEYHTYLTHSLAVTIDENNTFVVFINGLPLGNGTLSKESIREVTHIVVSLINTESQLEVGQMVVSNNPEDRMNSLINSFLRFRKAERAAYLRKLVDDAEIRLFGKLLDEGVDFDDEEGALLSFKEADPRKFAFPWVVKAEKKRPTEEELYGTPEGIQERLERETTETRKIQEVEEEEEENLSEL